MLKTLLTATLAASLLIGAAHADGIPSAPQTAQATADRFDDALTAFKKGRLRDRLPPQSAPC